MTILTREDSRQGRMMFERQAPTMSITNAEYHIKIAKGAEIVNQRTGITNRTARSIFTWAAKDKDSGCMLFDYTGSTFYVMERDSYTIMPEGRQS